MLVQIRKLIQRDAMQHIGSLIVLMHEIRIRNESMEPVRTIVHVLVVIDMLTE